jgi:hypothetical protein
MVMHMTMVVMIAMLTWLQLKHFVADYLLQPAWMLDTKGDLRRMGGYTHAGIHAFGSLPAFLITRLGPVETAFLIVLEFTAHYLIDFAKARMSRRIDAGPDTQVYWSLHGGDQLMHQLTYAGLIVAAGFL